MDGRLSAEVDLGGRVAPARGEAGLVACVAFAVGTMVGGGVFVLPGLAVSRTGPSAIVAFGLAGLLAQLGLIGWRHTLLGSALVVAGTGMYGLRGRHQPRHHRVIVEHLARGDTGRACAAPVGAQEALRCAGCSA